jgi:hypothetical protein
MLMKDGEVIIRLEGEVIIGEYSPRRSRGEYSPIITEPEANNCFSIFTQAFVFFETEFILISLIFLCQ